MSYFISREQLEQRIFIPPGTLRSWSEEDEEWCVTSVWDEYHGTALLLAKDAEFWDGKKWRSVNTDWDSWRSEVRQSVPDSYPTGFAFKKQIKEKAAFSNENS